MASEKNQISKLQFFNILLSSATILIILGYLSLNEYLYSIGDLWLSPVLWTILAGELLKHFCNKQVADLDGNTKDPKNKKKVPTIKSRVKECLTVLSLLFFSTLFFAIICVILGAPAFSSHQQTFSLSVLMTLTTVLPFTLLLSASGTLTLLMSNNFVSNSKIESALLELLKTNAVGVVLGAWGGSIVAPLDWDRKWQVYPIPNMVGALIGYLAGNVYTSADIILNATKGKLKKRNIL